MLFSERITPFLKIASIVKVIFLMKTEINPANKPTMPLNKNTKFFSEICLYLQISKRLKKLDVIGMA